MNYKHFLSLILPMLMWVAPVSADDAAKAVLDAAVHAGFTELEHQIIEKYYRERAVVESGYVEEAEYESGSKKSKKGKGSNLPPGLAKRGELPPGLAKLQKNGKMPPGLAKRSLPNDLVKKLPPPPAGYERLVVEDASVVLVHTATGIIADVIHDAIHRL